MHHLNARQKFATLFSFTVFGIIVSFCIVFITIFSLAQYTQIKKDLIAELENITENHLAIDKNSLTFVKDATGESLRQHLASTKISVAFYDTKYVVARSYGVFAGNNNSSQVKSALVSLFNQVGKSHATVTGKIVLGTDEYLALSSPIETPDNSLLGYVVLVGSLSPMYSSIINLVFISMGLATASLIISFGVGLLLMKTAFSSLYEITDSIGRLDLDKLHHHKVDMKGNPNDEVYILAEKFNEMIERLKIGSQKQKEFVANASHELKTPLTRMISSIDSIDSNEMRKDPTVSYIRQQLFEMAGLIDELLLLARLREHSPPEGRADIEKVMNKVVLDNQAILKQKSIIVEKNIDIGMILPIPESYLKIILNNLFTNAIKFSSVNSKIDISCHRSEMGGFMSITNYGATILHEDKDKLFDRFFRSNKSVTAGGAGIGLAIVKSLCDMYGIAISASSSGDHSALKSSTFTMEWKM